MKRCRLSILLMGMLALSSLACGLGGNLTGQSTQAEAPAETPTIVEKTELTPTEQKATQEPAPTVVATETKPVEETEAAPTEVATETKPVEETDAATPIVEPTTTPTPTEAALQGPERPVKIALLDALELDAGKERLDWARLAVEDFNAATGWSVELVEGDAGPNAATIMAAIDPVVGDGTIYAAIGPHRVSQIPAVSAMSDMVGLPHIIFNGYSGLTQPGNTILFRLVPIDDLQGPTAARFIVDTLGAKTVFIIVQQEGGNPGDYSYELYSAFEKTLTEAGGGLAGREPITFEQKDFTPLIDRIKASGPEAIFAAAGDAGQGAQIAQALREAGVNIPLVGHYGWAGASFAAAADGAYVLSYAPAVADPALEQRYMEQHGPFGVDGPLAYAATMMVLEAIQRAAESDQFSRAAVRDEIANTNQASSILGRPIAFEANGNLKEAQFYILQVENGTFKTVAP